MTRIPYERYKIEDPHGDTETGPLVLGSAFPTFRPSA